MLGGAEEGRMVSKVAVEKDSKIWQGGKVQLESPGGEGKWSKDPSRGDLRAILDNRRNDWGGEQTGQILESTELSLIPLPAAVHISEQV
jgi:hypothetical protein